MLHFLTEEMSVAKTGRKNRTPNRRATEYTTKYNENVVINLQSFIVDTSTEIPFNIYEYLGINLPQALVDDWDSDSPIPFTVEVTCIVYSGKKRITYPILVQSDQYVVQHPTLPKNNFFHAITREQHTFNWRNPIELPIFYSELPSDAFIRFSFSAQVFYAPKKTIGETYVRLFTRKSKRLRSGPFTLTFDKKPETIYQKHVRRVFNGKTMADEWIDDQFRQVSQALHPTDVEVYFKSLMDPLTPPPLSEKSQFVVIHIPSPNKDQSALISFKPLILPEAGSESTMNPCQRLYHDLAHSQNTRNSSLFKDTSIIEMLNKIKNFPPLAELQSIHKNLLYNNYQYCFENPGLLPALLRSVNWADSGESDCIIKKLETLDTSIDIEYPLEFFTIRYEVQAIREYAVRCIAAKPKHELLLYLPQLVQACKVKYSEGLDKILIDQAKDDEEFATRLYWTTIVESGEEPIIKKLNNGLLECISHDVRTSLNKQTKLVTLIQRLIEAAHGAKSIRDRVKELMQNDPQFTELKDFAPTRLPLDPTRVAVGIDPTDVKVFTSKLWPVLLTFKLEDGSNYRVIFKIGDDMRQDVLIIQLFEVMDNIFQESSLRFPITAYKTLAFSPNFGCCEFIENSKAIRDINKTQKIRDFLQEDDQPLAPKIEKFTASLAAYSVMTYVLKIGDRHDNNILVTRDGRLLHIDYGYILGDVTKPFTPPLKLSTEMITTIGDDGMQRLCGWAGPAFNSLRKRARLILILIELMFTAPLACFQTAASSRLQQVESALLLSCTEIEAMNSLQAIFVESLNSKMQVIWDAVHGIAQNVNEKGDAD